MLRSLAIALTGAPTLSVVMCLTALIVAGAMFLIRVRKMTIVGADARMGKGREQELRAKQEKFPLRDFSRRGNAYCSKVKPKVGKTIWLEPVESTVAGAEALVAITTIRIRCRKCRTID